MFVYLTDGRTHTLHENNDHLFGSGLVGPQNRTEICFFCGKHRKALPSVLLFWWEKYCRQQITEQTTWCQKPKLLAQIWNLATRKCIFHDRHEKALSCTLKKPESCTRQESSMIHSASPKSRPAVIFALFFEVLWRTDGGMDNLCENSDYYRPGLWLALWINKHSVCCVWLYVIKPCYKDTSCFIMEKYRIWTKRNFYNLDRIKYPEEFCYSSKIIMKLLTFFFILKDCKILKTL